jgi:GT2 family glycosyltransferase
MTPEVSIVVTTHDGYPFTRWCLESLAATLAPGSYEVILVDNGSADETLRLRSHYRFVENSGTSLYESWNLGIEAARTEFVVCTNNDIWFCTRDWWSWLRRGLERGVDWVYPTVLEHQDVDLLLYERIAGAAAHDDLALTVERGTISACCFAMRRSLLEDVGRFDRQFDVWYGEKDYEIRLLMAGRRYGEVANAVVRHFGASTIDLAHADPRDFAFERRGRRFEEIARADYDRFQRKHESTPLESIGLRMPGFGPLPLKAS